MTNHVIPVEAVESAWVVKRLHYSGGASIVAVEEFKTIAQNTADNLNFDYQTDSYYIEPLRDCKQ